MPTPNGGLITETNAQYYSGQQVHIAVNNGDYCRSSKMDR